MIKIDIGKEELEEFFDTLESDYKRTNLNDEIPFKKLKEYFCDDTLKISKNGGKYFINEKSKNNDIDKYNSVYENISSSNTKFYKKIRELIIDTFTNQIKFCPYCGKTPLIYFERGKDKINSYHRLFQLDHFFPKNTYHKGIINFYNLIPSCNACNYLKSDDNPLDVIRGGGEIFHPYFGKLRLINEEIKKEDKSFVNENNFINKAIYTSDHGKFFKLLQKYLNSKDTYNTLGFIKDKRNKIKDLKSKFPGVDFTDEYYKEYFFNGYYPKNSQDILKYSNGKLKKDLIEELKFKN